MSVVNHFGAAHGFYAHLQKFGHLKLKKVGM
jgi:hypothetical protein